MTFSQTLHSVNYWLIFPTCFWIDSERWKLVPGLSMILTKWQNNKICSLFVVAIYPGHPPKERKTGNFPLLVLEQLNQLKLKKGWKLSPSLKNDSKYFRKLLPLIISISWPNFLAKWAILWFQRYIQKTFSHVPTLIKTSFPLDMYQVILIYRIDIFRFIFNQLRMTFGGRKK